MKRGKRKDKLVLSSESWDTYFLRLAVSTARRSKDPTTKVGAVLVSPDYKRMSIGYNGFPSGIPDLMSIWTRREEHPSLPTKYEYVIHAELNAVLSAQCDTTGWSIYCTHHPCLNCTKVLIQKGIKKVIYLNSDFNQKTKLRRSIDLSKHLLWQAGIEVVEIDRDILNDTGTPRL